MGSSRPQTFNSHMKNITQLRVPDTLVLILGIMVCAWLLTAFVSVGSFETKTVSFQHNQQVTTKTILDASSFRYAIDENGEKQTQMASLFDNQSTGMLNAVFDGLTRGDRNGGAVGIIAFLLIIGGAFGIIMRPASIHKSMLRLLSLTRGNSVVAIPLFCFVFSLGGAVFGMGEEAIAFALLLTPIFKSQGYNGIVAILCTYVSTQIGFATSWMNPFNVAIAQGLAEVPVLSGAPFRFAMWCVFTICLMVFSTRYALTVRDKNALTSMVTNHGVEEKAGVGSALSLGDKFILLNLVAGIVWVIWGVTSRGYYIPEIASQFFTIGLTSALITLVFKLDSLTLDDMAKAFQNGASELLPAALIVGFAQGILLILGGADATKATALNTILYGISQSIAGLPEVLSAFCMLLFQSVFNFFVTSGSGQAALTMPLLAPIADLVDVTRQTAVLTFQLGDGLTNIIVPTSASLMGCLGAAKVAWSDWAAFVWKFLLFNMAVATFFVAVAVLTGY